MPWCLLQKKLHHFFWTENGGLRVVPACATTNQISIAGRTGRAEPDTLPWGGFGCMVAFYGERLSEAGVWLLLKPPRCALAGEARRLGR